MNYLACGTLAIWDRDHCDVQLSTSMNAGQPAFDQLSIGAGLHAVDGHTPCVPSMCCDCVLSDFSLKVNLGKSAAGGWSCRESASFLWLSKPWRWATRRNRGEISWEKQASWGSSTTPTSSTLKALSQKVGTILCGLLSLSSGWWESWLGKEDLGNSCFDCAFHNFSKNSEVPLPEMSHFLGTARNRFPNIVKVVCAQRISVFFQLQWIDNG